MVKRARATSTASADATYSDTYDDRAVTVSPSAKRRAVHSSSGTASSATSTSSADAAPVAPKVVKSEQRKLRNRESAQASRDRKKAEREELGLQLAQAEERVLQLEQENAKLRADAALREAHQSTRTAELEQQLRTFEDRFRALEALLATAQSAPISQPILPSASSASLTNLSLKAPSTTPQSTGLAGSETHATGMHSLARSVPLTGRSPRTVSHRSAPRLSMTRISTLPTQAWTSLPTTSHRTQTPVSQIPTCNQRHYFILKPTHPQIRALHKAQQATDKLVKGSRPTSSMSTQRRRL